MYGSYQNCGNSLNLSCTQLQHECRYLRGISWRCIRWLYRRWSCVYYGYYRINEAVWLLSHALTVVMLVIKKRCVSVLLLLRVFIGSQLKKQTHYRLVKRAPLLL